MKVIDFDKFKVSQEKEFEIGSKINNAKAFIPGCDIDPVWSINKTEQQGLLKYWETMNFENIEKMKNISNIFYSGCAMNEKDGRNWFIYKGIAIMRKENIIEVKRDIGRRFEKRLLKTAPNNLIPDFVFETEFNISAPRYRYKVS
jgi:hypothetical protein